MGQLGRGAEPPATAAHDVRGEPPFPGLNVPIAQVSLVVGQTAIANADITDERNLGTLGLGALALRDTVATNNLDDDAVTLAKLGAGTAGGVLGYDGAGDPVHLAAGAAGQVLTSNGIGAAPAMQSLPALGLRSVQAFTASGTWTRPAGINRVVVQAVGGGGCGGGSSGAGSASSGGGGGGGYATAVLDVSATPSAVVTVGAGGVGIVAGTGGTGGTSSFGAFLSTTGGLGGSAGTPAAFGGGGTGGSGSGGHVNGQGADGQGGGTASTAAGGSGGGSWLGAGGGGAAPAFSGRAAPTYGGGGGGSGAGPGGNGTGGAGSGGIVIVWEYA